VVTESFGPEPQRQGYVAFRAKGYTEDVRIAYKEQERLQNRLPKSASVRVTYGGLIFAYVYEIPF
jgi:hypothetical protein